GRVEQPEVLRAKQAAALALEGWRGRKGRKGKTQQRDRREARALHDRPAFRAGPVFPVRPASPACPARPGSPAVSIPTIPPRVIASTDKIASSFSFDSRPRSSTSSRIGRPVLTASLAISAVAA